MCEEGLGCEHLGEPLDEWQQEEIGHVRHEFVKHAALTEQRMSAPFGGVGLGDPAGISLGKKVMTSGIRNLGLIATVEIADRVAAVGSFTEDNDPHGEHDFGSFDYDGNRIFWKIDYYDRSSFGTGRDMGSENPSDPAMTLRVLTVMLASEY